MTGGNAPDSQLLREYLILSRQHGAAQARCSEVIGNQIAQIALLQAQVMRLRAALIVSFTRQLFDLNHATYKGLATEIATAPSAEGAQHQVELDKTDSQSLENSLAAADLVICQTGCLSHGDYWRVEDHCKRTGKSCVQAEQPKALRIVRIYQSVG